METGYCDNCIGFEYRGQYIINPWTDPSGRIEFNTEEAEEYYGVGFTAFCEDVSRTLGA